MHEQTRASLHAVAETILAGHQWRVARTIRLAAAPGGFATRPLPGDPELLSVRGEALVVRAASGHETELPLTGTLGALAAAAGVGLGAPEGVYADTTGAGPGTELVVDAGAAAAIAQAFADGDAAMRRLVAAEPGPDGAAPAEPVLWPEHFDLGVSLDEVNYGVSAGDGTIAEPYAYVGPWVARRGDFWDRPFGAARPLGELAGVDGLVAFLAEGREHARTDPPAG